MKKLYTLTFIYILFITLTYASSLRIQIAKPGPLTKCQKDCDGKYDCLQNCKKMRKEMTKVIATITCSVVFSCLVICGGCLLITHKRFRKFRLRFDGKFSALAKRYNNQNTSIISRDQFKEHVDSIVWILNNSRQEENFVTLDKMCHSKVQKIRVEKIKQKSLFHYNIELRGWEQEGNWSASGSIVSTSEGVILWFVKQYDDITWKFKDSLKKLIYKSKPSNLQILQGIWFDLGTQDENNLEGTWKALLTETETKMCESHLQIMK